MAQAYLVAAILLWAGLAKAVQRNPGRLMRLAGIAELVTAALLVVWSAAGAWAATALSVGFIGYLAYKRRVAPESSCGCLGAHDRPIDWRGFARAGFVLAASLLAVASVVLSVPLLAAEAALFLGLSAELDRYWLVPLRKAIVRLTRPLRPSRNVPLQATLQRLYRSPVYCSVSDGLRSDVLDSWDEDDWRFVTYASRSGETLIFAVPLIAFSPERIRVASVAPTPV